MRQVGQVITVCEARMIGDEAVVIRGHMMYSNKYDPSDISI